MPYIPKISFGIIVLNNEPFNRYLLRQIYPFAHQIIVVEGATRFSAHASRPDGHSRDGTLEILKEFPTVYKGTHINHPKVSVRKTPGVSIESVGPMLVYADGELLGECPAVFRVVPAALSLVV